MKKIILCVYLVILCTSISIGKPQQQTEIKHVYLKGASVLRPDLKN